MTGVALEISSQDLNKINLKLDQLVKFNPYVLMENIGALVESQTRRRLTEEKQAPDGTAWVEWSDNYARTRHQGQSQLENEGDLIDSIESYVSGGVAYIGTNLIYAATHQEGRDHIPARPFLGLSDENQEEIKIILNNYIEDYLK